MPEGRDNQRWMDQGRRNILERREGGQAFGEARPTTQGVEEERMSIEAARERVAQIWCQPTTENKVMDVVLAEEMAKLLEWAWGQPWLGNATTRELLDELRSRVDLDYKTVQDNHP